MSANRDHRSQVVFQILAYGANNAAAAALVDTPYIPDPSFGPQNGHILLYEDYELDAIFLSGASLTAAQLFTPQLNALNVPQIYPPNLSLKVPSNPQVMDLRDYPLQLPKNAQIACQLSNNLAMGNEWEFALIFMSPYGQPRPLPTPAAPYGALGRIRALFTVTVALTAGVWSPLAQIAVPNLIMQGTWAIVGAELIVSDGTAARVTFPRPPMFGARVLRPGFVCNQAYGNIPLMKGPKWMGTYGYFDTTEFPYLEILANTTVGSATYTGYLDLVFMGNQLLSQQMPAAM
jgi:hypothetical protein